MAATTLVTLGTLLFAALSALGAGEAAAAQKQNVAYYPAYAGAAEVTRIPWQAITRLNVAFIGIDGAGMTSWLLADGSNRPDVSGNTLATVRKLVAARNANNPAVKLVLSVGGASMSNRFSAATRTPEGRATLARTAVEVADTLGLDGVDYDWEYPGRLVGANCAAGRGRCESDADFANFTLLLQATRAAQAPGQLLTVAVYFDPSEGGVAYDVAGMDAQLDAWNVMAYDAAAPSWSPTTAFPAGAQQACGSLDAFVRLGATPAKLMLGVPLYGYIWRHVPYAGEGVLPSGPQGDHAQDQYSIRALFARYAGTAGCKLYETPRGDYYYCATGALRGEWCPIDSVRILQDKGRFVRDNGFGGLMSWVVTQDTASALMTRTLQQSLR